MTVVKEVEEQIIKCDRCGKTRPGYKSLKAVCEHLDEKAPWYLAPDDLFHVCFNCHLDIMMDWFNRFRYKV